MKLCIAFLIFTFLSIPGKGLTIDGKSEPNLLEIGSEIVRRALVVAKSDQINREHDRIILLEYVNKVQQLMDEFESAKDKATAEHVIHRLIRAEYHLSMLLQNYYPNFEGTE